MGIGNFTAALLATILAAGAGDGAARPHALAVAPPAPPATADWRTPDPQNVRVIDTKRGRILVVWAPAVAPLAAARLRDLARTGFYDGRAFFRVIDNFMDQTGDPSDTGSGGSSQANLPPEFTFRRSAATPVVVIDKSAGLESGFVGVMPLISQTLDLAALTADHQVTAWPTFCSGVVGLARAEDPASANSQFFLMRADNRGLDQKYTAAGRVISGMEMVRAIKTGEPVEAAGPNADGARSGRHAGCGATARQGDRSGESVVRRHGGAGSRRQGQRLHHLRHHLPRRPEVRGHA